MSSKDNRSGAVGKTVIRQTTNASAGQEPHADATVIASGSHVPSPDIEPMVSATPGVADAGGGALRTVIAEVPAEPTPGAPPRVPLADDVRTATETPGGNAVLAAATPILLLLDRLARGTVAVDLHDLRGELADGVRVFAQAIEDADIPPEDRRLAVYALCEMADDIVLHLPQRDVRFWSSEGMLPTFFGTRSAGTGFFQALNRLLAEPEGHRDVLALMHACLSLGFAGQYRSRQGAGLDAVRADAHRTLREMAPPNALTRRGRAGWTPLVAAALGGPAILTLTYLALATLLERDAGALAGDLRALRQPAAQSSEPLPR